MICIFSLEKKEKKVFCEELKYTSCITVKGKTDGFGAQYNAIMSGIAYSSYCNIEYCHTPIKKTGDHIISLSGVNKIIGYDKGYNCSSRCAKHIHFHSQVEKIGVNIVYNETMRLQVLRKHFNQGSNEIPSACQYSNSSIISIKNIAIHVRRGDVKSTGRNQNRYIPLNNFLNFLNKYDSNEKIKASKNSKNIKLMYHIFTEKNTLSISEKNAISNFKKNKTLIMHDSLSALTTFKCFVYAEVLILSKSAFSLAAAYLTEGDVFYTKFTHVEKTPLSHWQEWK